MKTFLRALCLVALSFAGLSLAGLAAGCQSSGSSADLATFRTSLQPLDFALYQQHTDLMKDAVKAGIRTPADQQVVAAEVAAAQSHYTASGTTQPAAK